MALLGFLSEGAATNICLQSNSFTTTWTNYNLASITQNAVGPDGATSAWSLVDSSAIYTANIQQAITLTAASYTASVFVKKTSGATVYPTLYAINGTNIAICTIDTNNGVATPWTAYTSFSIVTATTTCTSFNASYWRVTMTFTGTAASWTFYITAAATANATQSTGTQDTSQTGTNVFYGAQVELGSKASSYISTTTTSVTRAADSLTYATAGNFSDTTGALYAKVTYPAWTSAASFVAGSSTTGMQASSANSGVIGKDGTNTVNGPSGTPSGSVKMALSWTGSTMLVDANGGTATSGSYDGSWNLTTLGVAVTPDGLNVRDLYCWQSSLSGAQLALVTT